MQITPQHSYRAIIRRHPFNPAHPSLGTEKIGLKAANCQDAYKAAHEVTGCPVVVVYRQDRGAK